MVVVGVSALREKWEKLGTLLLLIPMIILEDAHELDSFKE